jgi:hypothetical protein
MIEYAGNLGPSFETHTYVAMFGLSLPPVVCRRDHVILTLFICVCLRIVVSKTYFVVFLFCFSSSCVPYVASFSGLSILDCPFSILSRLFNG